MLVSIYLKSGYVGSGDGRLYKLATSDGTLQWMTHIWAWPYTYGLALSPDESLIAAGVKTGEVSVVRTSDGTRLWDYDLGIMSVRWVEFSPDGTMLVAGSGAPGGTTIFNATDGRPLWRTCFSGAGMYTTDGNHILSSYDPDGTIANYEWNFDDGNVTNTTEPIITHSYSSADDYVVNLTVTDDDGATNATAKMITVSGMPDLIITEKWLCWPDNRTICYNVTNIGDGTAPACHSTTLYVDSVAVAHDHSRTRGSGARGKLYWLFQWLRMDVHATKR